MHIYMFYIALRPFYFLPFSKCCGCGPPGVPYAHAVVKPVKPISMFAFPPFGKHQAPQGVRVPQELPGRPHCVAGHRVPDPGGHRGVLQRRRQLYGEKVRYVGGCAQYPLHWRCKQNIREVFEYEVTSIIAWGFPT